jgi:hypothetical protein
LNARRKVAVGVDVSVARRAEASLLRTCSSSTRIWLSRTADGDLGMVVEALTIVARKRISGSSDRWSAFPTFLSDRLRLQDGEAER